MSYADTRRILDLEAEVAALLARVAVLEDVVADTRAFCEARQGTKTPSGVAGSLDCAAPAQRPANAPGNDAALTRVVEALEAGQSIRSAARTLNLDRNTVFRCRKRAIAEGRLAVSPA